MLRNPCSNAEPVGECGRRVEVCSSTACSTELGNVLHVHSCHLYLPHCFLWRWTLDLLIEKSGELLETVSVTAKWNHTVCSLLFCVDSQRTCRSKIFLFKIPINHRCPRALIPYDSRSQSLTEIIGIFSCRNISLLWLDLVRQVVPSITRL